MKNLLIALLLGVAFSAQSGTPVTDPTSYTYYIQELKKAQEQIDVARESLKQAEENVKQVQEVYNATQEVGSKMEGIYDRAVGFTDSIRDLKDAMTDLAQEGEYSESLGEVGDALGSFSSATGKAAENLEEIYADTEEDSVGNVTELSSTEVLAKREKFKQGVFKANLIRSDVELRRMPSRLDEIDSTVSRIDTTQNLKDALDLNSRLQAESIAVQLEILAALHRANKSDALSHYVGGEGEKQSGYQQQQNINSSTGYESGSPQDIEARRLQKVYKYNSDQFLDRYQPTSK